MTFLEGGGIMKAKTNPLIRLTGHGLHLARVPLWSRHDYREFMRFSSGSL